MVQTPTKEEEQLKNCSERSVTEDMRDGRALSLVKKRQRGGGEMRQRWRGGMQ